MYTNYYICLDLTEIERKRRKKLVLDRNMRNDQNLLSYDKNLLIS